MSMAYVARRSALRARAWFCDRAPHTREHTVNRQATLRGAHHVHCSAHGSKDQDGDMRSTCSQGGRVSCHRSMPATSQSTRVAGADSVLPSRRATAPGAVTSCRHRCVYPDASCHVCGDCSPVKPSVPTWITRNVSSAHIFLVRRVSAHAETTLRPRASQIPSA